MNNLTPELRMDKNGHLVTRHVKNDDGSSGVPLNAPMVALPAEDTGTTTVVPKQRVITIRPVRVERAVKRLEAANKRLERAGMEGFTWQVTAREENLVPKKVGFNGITEYIDVVDLIVDYPQVKTATHDFVGSLTQEETGMITRLSEGTELGDWRPRDSFCDHCGTNRKRNFTVIVREQETGEYSQVGSSCVEGYLGVDPAHLFSLNFDPLGDDAEEPQFVGKYGPAYHVEHKADVRKALAVAFVVSNNGENYKKRGDWWQGIPSERNQADNSTYSSVVAGLRDVEEGHPDHDWIKGVQQRAKELLDDGSIDTFIAEILNDDKETGEYFQNLKVLLSGDECQFRNMGALVAAVSVYHRRARAKQNFEERDIFKVNEWMGKPNDKLADLKAKIERIRFKENPYNGGQTAIVTMRLESGHEVTWFASTPPDAQEGDNVEIKTTTIKKHDEWQGRKSTVITRTKLSVVESAPEETVKNEE